MAWHPTPEAWHPTPEGKGLCDPFLTQPGVNRKAGASNFELCLSPHRHPEGYICGPPVQLLQSCILLGCTRRQNSHGARPLIVVRRNSVSQIPCRWLTQDNTKFLSRGC